MTEAKHLDLGEYSQRLRRVNPVKKSGRIVQVVGLTIEAVGIDSQIGDICEISTGDGVKPVLAEVVGFKDERMLLMPFGNMEGIQPGSYVYPAKRAFRAPVGTALLGRILNGLGQPIDNGPSLDMLKRVSLNQTPPMPLNRPPITETLYTGIRTVDGFLTLGKGQRMGIFAGSGVGKSTLMGQFAKYARADVNVVALVGERGREVLEFIQRDLGKEGLARSVVVVSTSDTPALVRLKSAILAMTIAESFRDMGMDVLFMMDSVTRYAMAQREIGLAVGEPPASKGYPPSVFALLPRLLERAGTSNKGSITGLFTVLVEGDDFTEPICDTVRSIIDGHIVLTRNLAARNHYPAIDVLSSVSRVMPAIVSKEHRSTAAVARRLLATYEKARDLINIGAYVSGSDQEIDDAIEVNPEMTNFLQQETEEFTEFDNTVDRLAGIVDMVD